MSGVGKSGNLGKEDAGLHIFGHFKQIRLCAAQAKQLPPPL
jgi:hypothetical protein